MAPFIGKQKSVYIVDDHAIVRDGLKMVFSDQPGYRVVGESGDGGTALEEIRHLRPDIALIDISMPVMTGIDLTRHLRKHAPDTAIVILSRHENSEYVTLLVSMGIKGYLLKDDSAELLIKALDEIREGRVYLSPGIASQTAHDTSSATGSGSRRDGNALASLTNREKEILKLVAEGNSNAEIAALFGISELTVKTHRYHIMEKLDLHKLADLVLFAVKNGLIES